MKYNAILFDLDGTLLDTLSDLTDAINHMLEIYNLPTHSTAEVRRFVGNGLRKLVERAVAPHENEIDIEKFYTEFVDYYNTHNRVKTDLYPNTTDTIKQLYDSNIKMAIVTNKNQTASDLLTRDFFYPYLTISVGVGNNRQTKPHPDNVNEAMRLLEITDKSKVLYVGDSEVDAQTAINSNLDYVLCTWGFRDMKDLECYNPVAYIDNISELLKYV